MIFEEVEIRDERCVFVHPRRMKQIDLSIRTMKIIIFCTFSILEKNRSFNVATIPSFTTKRTYLPQESQYYGMKGQSSLLQVVWQGSVRGLIIQN